MSITKLLFNKSHDYTDRIKSVDAIIVDKDRNKDEEHIHYELEQWKKKVRF